MDNFLSRRWLTRVLSLALCCHVVHMELPDHCQGNLTYVDCHGLDIPDAPKITAPITHLDLSQNKVSRIESLMYQSLLYLNMSHNAISHIHMDAFQDLNSLVTLDLSFNAISGVNFTQDTFKGLKALKHLYLQGNPIKVLNERTLDALVMDKLQTLDLSDCGLFKLKGLADGDLMYLETLSLRGNRLTESDIDIFGGLSFLESLDLSHNPIRRINDKPFYVLIHLTQLVLDSCEIQSFGETAFEGLRDLRYLSLRNNLLQDVDFNIFRPLDKLQELVLSGNPIAAFDARFFPKIEHFNWMLQTLRLDNMTNLETIGANAFSNLEELKVLSIQNNSILSNLEDNAFHIPYGRKRYKITIFLTNNALTSLSTKTLDWDRVERVTLSGNPWYCDCKLRWIFHVNDVSNKTGSIICQGPIEYSGYELLNLTPGELGCVNRTTKIALGIMLLLCICVVLGFCVYFILRWRRKTRYSLKDLFCCACIRGKEERYISVYQNDDLEPFARISFTDDEEISKKAVDV